MPQPTKVIEKLKQSLESAKKVQEAVKKAKPSK